MTLKTIKNSLARLLVATALLPATVAQAQLLIEHPPKQPAAAAKVPVISQQQFKQLLSRRSDTTYVVNMWATWCGPCVKELPHFEELHRQGQKVKVLLVSTDAVKDMDKVVRLLANKGITAQAMVLQDAVKQTEWMGWMDKNWQGEIPATLVYHGSGGPKTFHAGGLTGAELQQLVAKARQ